MWYRHKGNLDTNSNSCSTILLLPVGNWMCRLLVGNSRAIQSHNCFQWLAYAWIKLIIVWASTEITRFLWRQVFMVSLLYDLLGNVVGAVQQVWWTKNIYCSELSAWLQWLLMLLQVLHSSLVLPKVGRCLQLLLGVKEELFFVPFLFRQHFHSLLPRDCQQKNWCNPTPWSKSIHWSNSLSLSARLCTPHHFLALFGLPWSCCHMAPYIIDQILLPGQSLMQEDGRSVGWSLLKKRLVIWTYTPAHSVQCVSNMKGDPFSVVAIKCDFTDKMEPWNIFVSKFSIHSTFVPHFKNWPLNKNAVQYKVVLCEREHARHVSRAPSAFRVIYLWPEQTIWRRRHSSRHLPIGRA